MPRRIVPAGPPAFLQSKPIRPAVIRGQLVYTVADVAFTSFRLAACAWSAAECHRLDIAEPIDKLIAERAVTLADMRNAGRDMERFNAASKREADLAARIRHMRRIGSAS